MPTAQGTTQWGTAQGTTQWGTATSQQLKIHTLTEKLLRANSTIFITLSGLRSAAKVGMLYKDSSKMVKEHAT